MRDDSRRQSRLAGVRGPGAGTVPVRAPAPDLLEAQPAPGTPCRGYGVSQATASRVITAYTPLIGHALESGVPTVEDLVSAARLIVDGTLLECWSWKNHPELYSGKHRTAGLNVQVARTQAGALAWVSDTRDGRVHDTEVLRRSGLRDVPATDLPPGVNPPSHIGDKGSIGLDVITPKRKPTNPPLHSDDKTYNRTVNQIGHGIERVIASIKTWRVLHTSYIGGVQVQVVREVAGEGAHDSLGGSLVRSCGPDGG